MEGKTDNELIAEFMGQHVTRPGLRRNVMVESFYADELEYNKSWDWLMPVVEKIEDIGHAFEIVQENATVFDHDSKNNLNEIIPICGESKIQATYQAVVEFIKWYNRQKEK